VIDPIAVVRTLGPVAVTVRGAHAPAELLWRKNLALLLYLARSPRGTRARDHLLGLLWGDRDEKAARHSLREAIRTLRRSLGDDAIEATHTQVRLLEGAVRLDVDDLEAAVAAKSWDAAAALVGGDFLEGFAVPEASTFEDWLSAERAQWRRVAVTALVAGAERRLATGDVAGAVDEARRALAIDPLADAAVRTLLQAMALAGDRAAALAEYDAFETRLAEAGLGTADALTTTIARRIREEPRFGARPTPAATRSSTERRRAPLVGRGDVLARLGAVWHSVREGQAALLVVEGDAGLGKTRLLDEIGARARLDGACTAVVRAVAADRQTPWAACDGLVLGGLADSPGIAGTAPGALAPVLSRHPELADRFPGAARAAALSPARAFAETVHAVLAEQPVFLAVDDAQHIDPESFAALEATLRDASGGAVCVLFTVTAHAPRPEIDALRARVNRDLPGTVEVLRPLEAEAIQQLAERALPSFGPEALDRVTRRVTADSAGLPLLAVELLHAIALGLELRDEPSAWPAPLHTLDETLPGDLPDAIVAAIRVGYRGLSADAQHVLAAGSVLGDRFTTDRVTRALDLDAARVAHAFDELEWTQWLTYEPRGYAFLARIVRDVIARDMLTAGQRQRILATGS